MEKGRVQWTGGFEKKNGLKKIKQFLYYEYFKKLEYANEYHQPPIGAR